MDKTNKTHIINSLVMEIMGFTDNPVMDIPMVQIIKTTIIISLPSNITFHTVHITVCINTILTQATIIISISISEQMLYQIKADSNMHEKFSVMKTSKFGSKAENVFTCTVMHLLLLFDSE